MRFSVYAKISPVSNCLFFNRLFIFDLMDFQLSGLSTLWTFDFMDFVNLSSD